MPLRLPVAKQEFVKVRIEISCGTYSKEYIEVEVETGAINPVYRLKYFIEDALKKNVSEGN